MANKIKHPNYESAGAWAKRYFLASRAVMESVLRPYDLGNTQWYVLYQLTNGGPTNQRDLMHMLKIERATVSGVIAALVRKGLIEQIPDPADRRQKVLQITTAGANLWGSLPDPIAIIMTVAFDGVDDTDIATASRVLNDATQRLINFKTGGNKV
ncbi:MAG TPA: MarR family transcriptional regulator [Ktedonobacteraceae bacterium]|nr:MarR family transcriptional regulator [Ktedonobacteraceae bacterium]